MRDASGAVGGAARQPLALLAEGLVAGLIGGAAVILVFVLHDAATGDALRTPSVLQALVTEGAESARRVEGELSRALAWNAIHLPFWMAAGLLAALAVNRVERHPSHWSGVCAAAAQGFTGFLALEGALGVPGLGRFQLLAGALVGSGAMLSWLWWRHPRVLEAPDGVR